MSWLIVFNMDISSCDVIRTVRSHDIATVLLSCVKHEWQMFLLWWCSADQINQQHQLCTVSFLIQWRITFDISYSLMFNNHGSDKDKWRVVQHWVGVSVKVSNNVSSREIHQVKHSNRSVNQCLNISNIGSFRNCCWTYAMVESPLPFHAKEFLVTKYHSCNHIWVEDLQKIDAFPAHCNRVCLPIRVVWLWPYEVR